MGKRMSGIPVRLRRFTSVALLLCACLVGSAAHGQARQPAFIWVGGVTGDSAVVKGRAAAPGATVRLRYTAAGGPAQETPRQHPTSEHAFIAAFTLTGLAPHTEYSYSLLVNNETEPALSGRFRTLGSSPFSFDFAVSGDIFTGSNARSFDAIAALDPSFFLVNGDVFYADITENRVERFRAAYDAAWSAPRQRALYRQTPLVYIWDDHDYGPDNSHGGSPARDAARAAYREAVPHYPLPSASPIYQAFSVGRTRFILTDLRSARSRPRELDDAAKSMLGTAQKEWLKAGLLAAGRSHAIVFWVTSVPWLAEQRDGGDDWGGYATERAELAAFIEENEIDNIVALAGDAHMIAADDGRHNTYGPSGEPLFPVLHAAPLHQAGSLKGQEFSHGAFANETPADGQFALVSVRDEGGPAVCLEFSGRRLPAGAAAAVELVNWQTCYPATPSWHHGDANHALFLPLLHP